MEGIQCTICGSSSARLCSGCHSAAYCTTECQQTDWGTHRHLCSAFKRISAPSFPSRPSKSHYLGIVFPMISPKCKPQLHWFNTQVIGSDFVNPDVSPALQIPGHERYISRGLQIVRGNILRGRPKSPNSLNICYLSEDLAEQLPINETLHGRPEALCAYGWGDKFWKGPIVAFLKAGNDFDAKKMMDINLTAYRDALDYLAYFRDTVGSMIDWPGSEAVLSKRVMEDRTGKVKGVRINCVGDQAGNPTHKFVQVDVPRAHPLFLEGGDDPLDIPEMLDELWLAYRYAGYSDRGADDARNDYGNMLLLSVAEDMVDSDNWGTIPKWRQDCTTGSLLIVNRMRQDLDVRKVRAVCELIEEKAMPQLQRDRELGDEEEEEREQGRMEVLDALTPEALKDYM